MAEQDVTQVSEEEIHAAIADVEGISPDEVAAAVASEDAPDNGGESPAAVVAEPASAEAQPSNTDGDGVETKPAASSSGPTAETSETPSAEGRSRDEPSEVGPPSSFVGRVRARLRHPPNSLRGVLARLRVFKARAPGNAAAKTSPDESPTAGGIYRLLDQALEALNRPLARFGDGARNVVGLAAIMTAALSFLALLLFPYLFPRSDPVTLLKEKRAQLDQQPATSPAPEPPAAEPPLSEPPTEGD
jgi:hypothetical protein